MFHVSGQMSPDGSSVLKGCLVDGDPEQRVRDRKVRRRALVLSIGMQSFVVAVIALVPMLGRPARIALANVTPVPPYYPRPTPLHAEVQSPHFRRPENVCRICAPRAIPPNIVFHDPPRPDDGDNVPHVEFGSAIPGAIPVPDSRAAAGPRPPRTDPETQHAVRVAHIDPALLTRRIEPVYPALAKHIGRSGRVELRAVIAADGTIQSLEAVSGDPLFYPSALEAVRQWKYTPTVLNGQKVEVDTYITVIYNLRR